MYVIFDCLFYILFIGSKVTTLPKIQSTMCTTNQKSSSNEELSQHKSVSMLLSNKKKMFTIDFIYHF